MDRQAQLCPLQTAAVVSCVPMSPWEWAAGLWYICIFNFTSIAKLLSKVVVQMIVLKYKLDHVTFLLKTLK
jgi:hypothetical protein